MLFRSSPPSEACVSILPLQFHIASSYSPPSRVEQVQEFQLGTFLRSTYLDSSSPTFINGIDTDVVNITQLAVRADAAGEGSVILNSVQGLLQGLFSPTPDNKITLANGTTIVSPLGGYQYIPGTLACMTAMSTSEADFPFCQWKALSRTWIFR